MKESLKGNRILVYCPVFAPEESGYSKAFIELIKNLSSNNYSIDVLTPQLLPTDIAEPFTHPNVKIIRYNPHLRIWALGLFYRYKKISNRIAELNRQHLYDLILVETADDPLLFYYLPKYILAKTVVRVHSTSDTEYLIISNQKKYRIRRFIWKWMASTRVLHVAATSSYHLNYFVSNVLYRPKLLSQTVITNSIETPAKFPEYSHSGIRFLMLGRMDEEGYKQKGYQTLINALPLISEEMCASGSFITIIGNGVRYEDLKRSTEQYSFVKLIPQLSNKEIVERLVQSDVVLLPSLYEGVSMFALEAMASHNAVIYTSVGGLVDMVDGNGFSIDPGSFEQLAEAILKMINMKNINDFKDKSVELVRAKFGNKLQLKQFEGIHNKIVHES